MSIQDFEYYKQSTNKLNRYFSATEKPRDLQFKKPRKKTLISEDEKILIKPKFLGGKLRANHTLFSQYD